MTTRLRWAARYAFTRDVWYERPRVIFDRALERVLRDAGPGVAHGSDAGLRELVDALVPVRRGEPVWMAVEDADVAAELGVGRRGTTFVPRDALVDVVRRAGWEVALIDLPLDPERLRSLLVEVGSARQDRAVVVAAAAREFPQGAGGVEYAELAALVDEHLGDARVFGAFEPPMVAFVEFGQDEDEPGYDDAQTIEVTPADLEAREADDAARSEDDEVPLAYDNTLGSQDPTVGEFIVVVGGEVEGGLTLVELAAEGDGEGQGELVALRTQLSQAKRRADEAAIARQAELERAELTAAELAAAQRTVAELKDSLARAVVAPEPSAPDRAQLEAAAAIAAREQALRWKVNKLEREVAQLVARPVDPDEAQRASEEALAGPKGDEVQQSSPREQRPRGGSSAYLAPTPRNGARRAPDRRGLQELDALVRRIERGGIGALELRHALLLLRRRFA